MVSYKINNCYINRWYAVSNLDEKNSNLKKVNSKMNNNYYDEESLEQAEIKMEREVYDNLNSDNVNLIIGGDLSNQIGDLNYSLKNNNKSYLGIYNACATFIEGLIIGARFIENNFENMIITSSHNMVSERQFRFPNEYGSLKKNYSTNTITASIGVILSKNESNIKVTGATIGSVIDYEVDDVSNMGAIMAPAAANTIVTHLINMNKSIDEYDLILTGDLGSVGITLLKDILAKQFKIVAKDNIKDAGCELRNDKKYAGASGPTVLPMTFFYKFLLNKKYSKILLVGTGSLHNPTLVNQKLTIPSISHAIEIEVSR